MADVKSKNLYELLGNDSDQDSDREPGPPTKVADKPTARTGKRDAPQELAAEPPAAAAPHRGGRGGRGRGFGGSEGAFRDRNVGREQNRSQPTEEGEGARGGYGGRRGGRGPRGPRRGGDRHSRTGITEHQKQTDQGWGAPTGEAEWTDEKAGEAIAKEEEQTGGWDANVQNNDVPSSTWDSGAGAENPEWKGDSAAPPAEDGAAAPTAEAGEPEEAQDTHKSYAEYVSEQNAKKLKELGIKEARQPNEGVKENKQWKSAKPLSKEEEGEEYFMGEKKERRERERAKHAKERVDIDFSFKEQARETRGGGRGRGRGRGVSGERGEFRGGRGRGDFSGGDRGDRPRGPRGGGEFRARGGGRARGGRDSDGPTVAVDDESAFPSLGSK